MNEILNNIDEFLESQKEQEQKLFMFLPILLFGFIIYYFIYPITQSMVDEAQNSYLSLEKDVTKIKKDNFKLKTNNIKMSKAIRNYQKELKNLEVEKATLNKILKKIEFLKFDLDKWARFYNDIPNLSEKNNVILTSLKNELRLDNNVGIIQNKMSINIKAEGNFIKLLKFINEFEKRKELIKVKSLKITHNIYTKLIALKQSSLEDKIRSLLFDNSEENIKLKAIQSLRQELVSSINAQKYRTIINSVKTGRKEMNPAYVERKQKKLEALEKKEMKLRKEMQIALEQTLYNLFDKKQKDKQLNKLVSKIVNLDERNKVKEQINQSLEDLQKLIKYQEKHQNKLNISMDIYGVKL